MWDVVMLALGLGFFAVGIGYAYACERLSTGRVFSSREPVPTSLENAS